MQLILSRYVKQGQNNNITRHYMHFNTIYTVVDIYSMEAVFCFGLSVGMPVCQMNFHEISG